MSRTACSHADRTVWLSVTRPTRGSRGGAIPARLSVTALQPRVVGRRRSSTIGSHLRQVCHASFGCSSKTNVRRPLAKLGDVPEFSARMTSWRRNGPLT